MRELIRPSPNGSAPVDPNIFTMTSSLVTVSFSRMYSKLLSFSLLSRMAVTNLELLGADLA